MSKIVLSATEAKEKLQKGINTLADAVASTLGPNGRNVLFEKEYGEIGSTKDGVTVAKEIELEDPIENMGATVIKQAAIKTVDITGDGTTTSTVLARELINDGFLAVKTGSNVVEVVKGMNKATALVIEELKKLSKDIVDETQLKQVATISANNDEEIGNLVATAIDKVGRDGVVIAEKSRTGETSLEIVEGMQFDRGYKSPFFVTDNAKMQTVMNDAYILLYDKPITKIADLLPVLEKVSTESKSLVIIAEDIESEALATLIINKQRGTLKVVAVKAPDFGERRLHILEDIAVLTGGTLISSQKGMSLEEFDFDWLGQARVVTVDKDTTTIVDGKGDEAAITTRMLELKSQIDLAKSPYEIEKLQDRLSKMAGGVAIINVGGANEIEIEEKKDRVDDALHATKASLEEGIVPGGGVALLRSRNIIDKQSKQSEDQTLGMNLIYDALSKPFKQILQNAGFNDEDIFEKMYNVVGKRNPWIGINVKTDKVVDMFEAGVIDPTKVVKNALLNAVAVASTLLITECVVARKKEDKKEIPQQGY